MLRYWHFTLGTRERKSLIVLWLKLAKTNGRNWAKAANLAVRYSSLSPIFTGSLNSGSADSINSATSALRFSSTLHVYHVTGIAAKAEERKIRNDRISDFFRYYFIIIFATSGAAHHRSWALTYVLTTVCFPNSVRTEEERTTGKRERERVKEADVGNSTGNNNRTDFNGYCALRLLLVLPLMLQLLYIFPISSTANFGGTAKCRVDPYNYYRQF